MRGRRPSNGITIDDDLQDEADTIVAPLANDGRTENVIKCGAVASVPCLRRESRDCTLNN